VMGHEVALLAGTARRAAALTIREIRLTRIAQALRKRNLAAADCRSHRAS
jgi:hypothetical protein